MNPTDQIIADARNHLDLLNDAARKREGARIIERLLARVRELESTLAERWPNLAHQDRDRLLALCGGRADVWLSTAACETIERLTERVRELEAERAGLRWSDEKPTVPGWYWYRESPIHPGHIGTFADKYGPRWLGSPVGLLDGQFAGPIPTPGEPK